MIRSRERVKSAGIDELETFRRLLTEDRPDSLLQSIENVCGEPEMKGEVIEQE
ncbi:hypothetical protein KEJ39_09445 [Candidatus Bathyarchaeota archaeon]|nr:hypothetical protein [Candidatus Bathyarchaeota archaeon]